MRNCLILDASGKQISWSTERLIIFVTWPDSKRLHQFTVAEADHYHFHRLLGVFTLSPNVAVLLCIREVLGSNRGLETYHILSGSYWQIGLIVTQIVLPPVPFISFPLHYSLMFQHELHTASLNKP